MSLNLDLLQEQGLRSQTRTSAHTVEQYLQQNTEEMDWLSSPDATQTGGNQNDRFEGKTGGQWLGKL